MVALSLHTVQWSREQGHPVVILRADGHAAGNLSIVLSPSDAQLLAPRPPSSSIERLRLFGLLESATTAFEATLREVRLRLDGGMVLTAELCYRIDTREVMIPATFADALVLANRSRVPLLIAERDLHWIRAIHSPPTEAMAPAESPMAQAVSAFIESLTIDDL